MTEDKVGRDQPDYYNVGILELHLNGIKCELIYKLKTQREMKGKFHFSGRKLRWLFVPMSARFAFVIVCSYSSN
jgi:hypothetical protein